MEEILTPTSYTTSKKEYVNKLGFTLIELSIVMVIIGLIIGGVLVGNDLIEAAKIRSQITQIQKYHTAVNTFKLKYDYLPGDIIPSMVTANGFTAAPTRDGDAGRGNGDGIIHSYASSLNSAIGWGVQGESLFIWEDLSENSRLIEDNFNTAINAGITVSDNAGFSLYLPKAKIGNGNYITVFSVGGVNYFEIIAPYQGNLNSGLLAEAGMTVNQADAIDKKTDDGLPLSGKTLAAMSFSRNKAGFLALTTNSRTFGNWFDPAAISAASPSSATCYDTTSSKYSTDQNNGNGVNCGLSFVFQ